MTHAELYNLAIPEVKRIINECILPSAQLGILNIDIRPTFKDAETNIISSSVEFSAICQSIFTDLEYTCYLNDNNKMTSALLSIAWDKDQYNIDKNNITFNTALSISGIPTSHAQWVTNPVITKYINDITGYILLSGYVINQDNEVVPNYIIEYDNISSYINLINVIEDKYIPYSTGYLVDYTKNKIINLYMQTISTANDITYIDNPITAGIYNTSGYYGLTNYQINGSSVTLSAYPYYIVETSADTSNVLNKDLKFNKYIPYSAESSDYLFNKRTYEVIPSGSTSRENIQISSYFIDSIEYIDINNVSTSISDYNNNLAYIYNTLLAELNDEYNSLSANTDPSAIIRKNEILSATMLTIPQQYEDAKLKLIKEELFLSGIESYEVANNINIYFNADLICGYYPTGYITGLPFEFISGGQISSMVPQSGIITLEYNTPEIEIINDNIKLNLNLKELENNGYININVNYIEPIYNQYNKLKYNIISGEVDEWYNYYAKQYHDIAISSIPSSEKTSGIYNIFNNEILSGITGLIDNNIYTYNLSGIYTRDIILNNNNYFTINSISQVSYKEQLVVLNYLCKKEKCNMTFYQKVPNLKDNQSKVEINDKLPEYNTNNIIKDLNYLNIYYNKIANIKEIYDDKYVTNYFIMPEHPYLSGEVSITGIPSKWDWSKTVISCKDLYIEIKKEKI